MTQPVRTSTKTPGLFKPAYALTAMLFLPFVYAEALADGDPWYVRFIVIFVTGFMVQTLLSWVRDMVAWHREGR